MKSLVKLNNELDVVLNIVENQQEDIKNILKPLFILVKNNDNLKSMLPEYINNVSIKKIIERLNYIEEYIIDANDISLEEENNLIICIDNVIDKLSIINPVQEANNNTKIELELLINERKEYLKDRHKLLKDIDKKLSNTTNNSERIRLEEKKNKILSNKELYQDLTIMYDYSNIKDTVYEEEYLINNINGVGDLYRLIELTINNSINKFIEYKYISKDRLEDINNRLNRLIRPIVNKYIISNSNFKNIRKLHEEIIYCIDSELENYFELKNNLGVEYVDSDNKLKIIKVRDVVENPNLYLDSDNINVYASILELSLVNEDNVEVVRNYIKKMGPEFVSTFDRLWVQESPRRKRKIKELKKNTSKKEIE